MVIYERRDSGEIVCHYFPKSDCSRLGSNSQAVNQWFAKSVIPARFVLKLCEFVGWAITPHQVRPDLYPSELDGMPRAAEV
jgi:DNA-binding transcriptional regulator YdaS (Cro superfamily)